MNRTTDGRIIDKRVFIDKKLLKSLVLDIKNKEKITWKEFANRLNVTEQTLRHDWLNKKNTLPFSTFDELLKMTSHKIGNLKNKIEIKNAFWGQRLNRKNKDITLPNPSSKEFAEFFGIMLGDGCINSNLKGFVITGDKILEKDYYNYVSRLVENLFGHKPKILVSNKTRVIRAVFYSKKACEFITQAGFPIGLKLLAKLEIPEFIKQDKSLLALCLRGIMDTDGSLSSHPHSKIMIHLSIPHKDLRFSVSEGLRKLELEHGIFNKGIMIYGKRKVSEFQDKIGFSNSKNILKYEKFIAYGKVPSSKEIETFLMGE